MYMDVETGVTITREQLFNEYRERVADGTIDEQEQTFMDYLFNSLVRNGGTLEKDVII